MVLVSPVGCGLCGAYGQVNDLEAAQLPHCAGAGSAVQVWPSLEWRERRLLGVMRGSNTSSPVTRL
jgi:hypothetical protein